MEAKEFLANKGVDLYKIGLEHYDVECISHFDLVNYLDEYSNIQVMLELENIKKDMKALELAQVRPLCCEDIDELLINLRILQSKIIKK